jgi:hypothetical protein
MFLVPGSQDLPKSKIHDNDPYSDLLALIVLHHQLDSTPQGSRPIATASHVSQA